jgi:hypothetical protein
VWCGACSGAVGIAATPRPQTFASAASRPTDPGAVISGERADHALVTLTRRYLRENELRHLQVHGERLTFGAAAAIVAREHVHLLRASQDIISED